MVGWTSSGSKRTRRLSRWMTTRPPLFPGFGMLTALKPSGKTDRRIFSPCSGISQVSVMARRSRSNSMMCCWMTDWFLNSYLELARPQYRNFFAKRTLLAVRPKRCPLRDEGTLATSRLLLVLYVFSGRRWEFSGEERRVKRSSRSNASGIVIFVSSGTLTPHSTSRSHGCPSNIIFWMSQKSFGHPWTFVRLHILC